MFKNFEIFFDKGVYDHDVLVDLVHFPEGGKMQIFKIRAVLQKKTSTDSESATSIT